WMLFFNNGSASTGSVPIGNTATAGSLPGTDAGGPGVPTAPTAAGTAPTMAMAGTGAPLTPGATPAAAAGTQEAGDKPRGPGVPTRGNPFAPSKEIQGVLDSIPDIQIPPTLAAPHDLYRELYTPKPQTDVAADENDGPPVPPMRVAGIIQGSDQLTAMIQMGDVFMTVTPGNMIPEGNPVYRVERIEPSKVVLTRRWEMGERKGTQRIEVALANGAQTQPAAYGPGFTPGMGGNGPGMGGNGPGRPGFGSFAAPR
ncbi:MAG TPA: hypothetical protein VFU47_16685, partial [Armatimonadota bacterium]|nr:hypothetical protein [Armatimonadota bacterium]